MIPPRAGCFQDRVEAVRLREELMTGANGQADALAGQDAVRGRVLVGMGGVGKTQLAADHARRAWRSGELDVLVWITATSASAITSGYAQAAAEILGTDPADPGTAAASFLAWLEPKHGAPPCRWLVVLDDVADPADLRGLWPPAGPHGRTLATTRRRDTAMTAGGRSPFEVGLFTPAEALACLATTLAAHDRHEPDDQLAELAEELGRLPLALSQAAAYLIDVGVGPAAYRALLADRSATLADAVPDVLPDDQPLSLAAAWSLSVDRADTLLPRGVARPMLQLASLLDANGVPEAVLTSGPALTHLTAHLTGTGTGPHPAEEQQPPLSTRDAVRSLRALHRLSLVDHTPETPHQAVRVHQLVQRAVRDGLTPGRYDRTAHAAADALRAAWPAVERDTALAQALRANAAALTACAEEALYRPAAHAVLYRAGTSLGEAGQADAARDYYRRLTTTACRHLGEDHPDTLVTRHSLAYWQGKAGDTAGAAAATADLLPHLVRVLGRDHPDTLTARHNLAWWHGESGDAAGAAAAFADVLADRVRVLGPDHPDTLTARGNQAWWQGESGDPDGALAAFAELVTDRTRVLGPDHPRTLDARHSHAHWRGQAGDADEAVSAFADVVAARMRVLGPDHPDTLTARRNLAWWQGESGDPAGAAAAFAELLTDVARVLGPDHPDTLTTRRCLADRREE
ncbi:FxSxx-COOH system tetratricopeptide repeat protein [Streptomyces phaeofaciens]|uniref:FxSxx-COOH system tetratricopeptide repeat protein n=1 Tax=Streptomyces phaeofaciens TaxID=68254 RepID=UPI001E2DB397|nr:FxSxx-COOH system tetratricopeptide repeat protein [Streptomyces phaeofaciens]